MSTADYGNLSFGNVLSSSLAVTAASPKFERLAPEIAASVERCRSSCEYVGQCGGGASSNKYWEQGSFDCSTSQLCRYRIQLVTAAVVENWSLSRGWRAEEACSHFNVSASTRQGSAPHADRRRSMRSASR